MGKFKDIFTGEHRKFTWFVIVLTTAFIVLWFVGPGNTFLNWAETSRKIKSQEKQMDSLRQEINEMNQNIEELETNKDTLEKFARERFHFAAPGEDVYIVE